VPSILFFFWLRLEFGPTLAEDLLDMPNQLTLPSKYTSPIPLKTALSEYIQSAHTETHPDAFKWDVNRWEAMRKEALNSTVHVDVGRRMIT